VTAIDCRVPGFCDDLDDAHVMAGALTAENRQIGRRETYRIYELVEVEDE